MADQKRPRGNDYDNDNGILIMGDGATATNNLQPLQSAISTGDEGAITAALNQLMDESKEERVLMTRIPVLVSIKSEEDEEDMDNNEGEKEDNGDDDKDKNAGDAAATADQVMPTTEMSLIVTSERCLFVKSATEELPSNTKLLDNFFVDAESIQIHAQSADPVSVYLQVEGKDEESSPREISIIPNNNLQSAEDTLKVCENLFVNITKLIELHPIHEDDDNNNGGGMMGMMSMMAMMAGQQEPNGGGDRVQFADAMQEQDNGGREATPEERAAMLERLDSLLVVKPGLEVVSGQFSDAEEDDDEEDKDVAKQKNANKETQQAGEQNMEAKAAPPPKKGAGQFDDADDEDDPIL